MPPIRDSAWDQEDALAFENDWTLPLIRWRREQAILYGARIGLDAPIAATIADEPDFDLEQFRQLVEHGCPAELVLRLSL